MAEIKKILAFLKKEWQLQLSYRFNFILGALALIGPLIIFFFIDRLFGERITPHLAAYGGNYFAYILISLSLFNYAGGWLGSVSEKLREEEMLGTLESILATPISISTLIASFTSWNFIAASLEAAFYILVGIILLKNPLHPDYLSVSIILLLSIISFSSLGIISASFIMVFKRGDPLGLAFYGLSSLLGGVYFPVSVLPSFLQVLSYFLPITYAIRAMELAILRGYPIFKLPNEIIPLMLFSIFLFPLSLLSFKFAIRKAKEEGSLSSH